MSELQSLSAFLEPSINIGGIVLFLLYLYRRDMTNAKLADARENRMGSRINELEDYQKASLTAVITEATVALRENSMTLNRLDSALRRRPCLVHEQED